jgi:membrane-associated phospholipid phosphatase
MGLVVITNASIPVAPLEHYAPAPYPSRVAARARPLTPAPGRTRAFLKAMRPVAFLSLFVWADAIAGRFLPGVAYPIAVAWLALLYYVITPPGSDRRLWGVYILGFFLFASLSTFADNTGVRVSPNAPVSVGVVLSGQLMSTWLQGHLYRPGHIGPLEIYCCLVYLSFFFHYLVGFALWRLDPPRFRIFVAAVLGTVFLGLVGYFVFPEAPPWLASEQGSVTHVVRIADLVTARLGLGDAAQTSSALRVNQVAAMPSLHVALTAIVALTIYDLRRWTRVLGLVHLFSMCFAVIYLGEHYFIDVVAGLLLAVAVYRAVVRKFAVSLRLPDKVAEKWRLALDPIPAEIPSRHQLALDPIPVEITAR